MDNKAIALVLIALLVGLGGGYGLGYAIYQPQLQTIQNEMSGLHDELHNSEDRIRDLNSTLNGLQSSVSTLNTELNMADSDIASMQSELTDLNIELNTINSALSDLESSMLARLEMIDLMEQLFHYKGIYIYTNFESLDGYGVSAGGLGTITLTSEFITFTTGAVSGNENILLKYYYNDFRSRIIDFSRDSAFRTTLDLNQVTNQTIYASVGFADGNGAYGFKIVNNQLYGYVNDGAAETLTAALATLTASAWVLEARFIAGKRVDFYYATGGLNADLTFIGSLSTGLPSSMGQAEVAWLYTSIKTNENAAKVMNLTEWFFHQKP